MKINGISLDLRISGMEAMLKYFERLKQLRRLCLEEVAYKAGFEDRLMVYQTLQLTEEKRRLLTCIIEWMTSCALASEDGPYALVGIYMNNVRVLIELHKRVNSAKTMEELAEISQELVKFKKEHPELDNN